MLLRIWRGRVRFGHVDQTRGTEVGVSGLCGWGQCYDIKLGHVMVNMEKGGVDGWLHCRCYAFIRSCAAT
jgi:hypothetical protein